MSTYYLPTVRLLPSTNYLVTAPSTGNITLQCILMPPNLYEEDSTPSNISTTILQMSPRVQVQEIWPVHNIYRCDYEWGIFTQESRVIYNYYLTCLIHGYESLLYISSIHLIVLSLAWMIHNISSISPGWYTRRFSSTWSIHDKSSVYTETTFQDTSSVLPNNFTYLQFPSTSPNIPPPLVLLI